MDAIQMQTAAVETAAACGLYLAAPDSIGVVVTADGQPVRPLQVLGKFQAGAVAWTDRVQDPVAEAGNEVLRGHEADAERDAIERMRTEGLGDLDRCDECLVGKHTDCSDVEDGSCCCPPGPDRHYFEEPE